RAAVERRWIGSRSLDHGTIARELNLATVLPRRTLAFGERLFELLAQRRLIRGVANCLGLRGDGVEPDVIFGVDVGLFLGALTLERFLQGRCRWVIANERAGVGIVRWSALGGFDS